LKTVTLSGLCCWELRELLREVREDCPDAGRMAGKWSGNVGGWDTGGAVGAYDDIRDY